MFKPKEFLISAATITAITLTGMPKAESVSINRESNIPTNNSSTLNKTLKDTRLAYDYIIVPEVDSTPIIPDYTPIIPETNSYPIEPEYIIIPRTGGEIPDFRENLKGYHPPREYEFVMGDVDEEAMMTNCREEFGQSAYASEMFELGDKFKCNEPEYTAQYIHTRTVVFNKQKLCERMAGKNYKFFVFSRNLKSPNMIGGYFDESQNNCSIKISAQE